MVKLYSFVLEKRNGITSTFFFTMKKIFFLLFLAAFTDYFAQAQKQTYLLVGTYTSGKSKGIPVFRFDTKTGDATLVDSAVTQNPSYLAVSPNQQYVYAVNEIGNSEGGGKVTAYRFGPNGHLTELSQQQSMGEHPCYVTVSKDGKWVIAGNYSSGTAAVLPVERNGALGLASDSVKHSGRGVHSRQESPHVHATVLSPDNRFLFVPDLGIDKLMIYSFDAQRGTLQPKDTILKLAAGSGPRHFIFHPNDRWAYLVQELTGTVTAFRYNAGKLTQMQTVSVLPKGFTKSFTSADIHISPDGQFLYTSTRDSANLLTIFRINNSNGKLTVKGFQPVLGKTPRNFNFDPSGNFLLVANQNSDEIVVFKVNKQSGGLTDTGKRISVGNPVCIKWVTN